jgi:hypothetical protein
MTRRGRIGTAGPRRKRKAGQTNQSESDSQTSRKNQPKKMSNKLKSNNIGKKKQPKTTLAWSKSVKVNQTDLASISPTCPTCPIRPTSPAEDSEAGFGGSV